MEQPDTNEPAIVTLPVHVPWSWTVAVTEPEECDEAVIVEAEQ